MGTPGFNSWKVTRSTTRGFVGFLFGLLHNHPSDIARRIINPSFQLHGLPHLPLLTTFLGLGREYHVSSSSCPPFPCRSYSICIFGTVEAVKCTHNGAEQTQQHVGRVVVISPWRWERPHQHRCHATGSDRLRRSHALLVSSGGREQP